ncbi:MAG: PAS domain-containing sensor histidine kinase [Actinobacteria bacterium]|nr:MAG: PAS domain-containing sensor histidine kinase [Actinomycetota bacterium]
MMDTHGQPIERPTESAEHDMLSAIVDGTSDAVYVKDLHGRYLLFNTAASVIVGKPAAEVLGADDTAIFAADEARMIMEGDRGVMDAGEVQTYEETLTDADGHTRTFLSTKGPTRDAQGRVTGIFGIARDITPLREAELAERRIAERLQSTMDSMLEGCQIIGFDWRYIYINDAAQQHNRRPREAMLGQVYTDIWPDVELTEVYERIRTCLEMRVGHRMDNEFRFPDGTVGWFELDIQPVPEGVFILSIDITQRKHAENELAVHRDHLEELVRSRTRELEAAAAELTRVNRELQSATQAKNEFLASMSHELRTPLNSIIGFSDMMSKGLVGALDDEQKKQIGMINRSGLHLLSLINDVLDLAKIEAGAVTLEIEEFDLATVVAETAATLRPLAASKGVGLLAETVSHCTIESDRHKIVQVLLNLGGNAIKFTDAGTVSIEMVPTGSDVRITVKDTGRGIPAEQLDRIFDAFTQVHHPDNTRPEGTGLGLAISRQYAELLGGQVLVSSTPDVGSTFTLVLPRR